MLTDAPMQVRELPARIRRMLELVYEVEGVASARIWQWDDHVAVGVRPTMNASGDLLRRVERAVDPLRQPDERWDFGFLDEAQAN